MSEQSFFPPDGELLEDSVVKDFFTTAADGKQYNTRHYILDAIISVGYRAKSHWGTWCRACCARLGRSGRRAQHALPILQGAGKVSHEQALKKAQIEFEKYRQMLSNAKSPVEEHFEEAVKQVKALERSKPATKKNGGK